VVDEVVIEIEIVSITGTAIVINNNGRSTWVGIRDPSTVLIV